MLKSLGGSIALAGLLALTAGGALGQNKDKKKDAKGEQATPQEYGQLGQVKQISGKLASVDAGSKTVTFTIDIPHAEPNPNYRQNANNSSQYRQMQQQLNRALHPQHLSSNPITAQQQIARAQQQQMQQLARMYNGQKVNPNNLPYKIVTTTKSFDLEVEDKVAVRKTFVGTDYDDQGNLKQYTPAQLAALKGTDASKPGYAAKYEDLQPGQEVTLYLTPPKGGAKKEEVKKADPKKGDVDLSNVSRPTVRMIVMTKEMAGISAGDNNANKKKNK